MRSLSVPRNNQFGSKNSLFKLISILFVLFVYSLSANAAVDEVFLIARKANAPNVYPDIFIRSFTKRDFNYDYELYQLSFDISAGEYLGFSLGFDNYTDSPSFVLFDNIELNGPSGAIAVTNAGFEQGTTGWTRSCPPWAISSFTISTDSYEGTNAAQLSVDNASLDGFCSIRNSTTIPIVETGTYTLSLYAKVTESEFPPDEIFAFEVGNQWLYGSNSEKRITSFDQTSFRKDTYEVEYFENSISIGSEWYEPFKGELRWWGFFDDGEFFRFEDGLVVAWFPASVGDRYETSTGAVGYIGTITMTVNVLAFEPVELGFGTVDAYRFRYTAVVSGPGGTETVIFDWWLVPYLGIVKMEDNGISEQLTSFAIGGGTITQDTDTDGDGLRDYQEMGMYNTDRLDTDTDDDGLSDGAEVNTHDTDPNDSDTDDDGLSDGEEINTYDTDPNSDDTDNDGLGDSDEINTYNTDPNNEDTDGDELNDGDEVAIGTNPNIPDTDEDGMPDGWEVTYGLEPLINDASGDLDGDGMSNLDEYQNGRNPNNAEPNAPELFSPPDGEPNVSLTPELETGDFSDNDEDDHALTQWQISTAPFPVDAEPDPEDLVIDLTSDTYLTLFQVPPLVLDANNTEYFWRARFTDSDNATSEWAAPFSFTTVDASPEDNDPADGIPDGQEADCLAIFDPDAIPPDTACFNAVVGNTQIGMQGSNNVAGIEACGSVDPATIPENLQGVELAMGLISFKATCNQPGDIIHIIYYSSEPLPDGAQWYKYDPINGWQDYSAHIVSISPDRKEITVEYQDGGFGDLDGIANGVIIDPSGPGVGIAAAGGGGGGGGGGCLISTASYGSRMLKEPLTLVLFLGLLMMGLSAFRKKFKK